MRSRLVWSLAALFALASVSHAGAQTTITLEGRVVDRDGAVVPSAQISVKNIETNENRLATTRDNGEFRLLGLFSGRYEISARALGFKPAADVVQLVVGQRAFVTLTLERGAAEISGVTVTGDRVKSVEVQRMSVSAAVLKQEIENLPLNSRGVMNLASIAPGIKSYAPQQGRALPSAGAAPDLRFINVYMDGVEMKSLFNGNLVGIPQTGSPLPQEALEEFRVYTTPYDAEFSRAGSYAISAVSRRGTNTWEGSAFAFYQNESFISRTFIQHSLNQQLPNFGRQQFGLNLRGPLVKDKLFLATSYELASTNNYIDVNPNPNRAQWSNFAGSFKAPNTNHTGFGRLTWVPNERNTVDAMLSSRYMTGEGNFGNKVAQNGGISQKYFINTGQLRHRWLSSGGLANEASLQIVSWYHDEPPLFSGPQKTYLSVTQGTSGFPLELRETHYRIADRITITKDNFAGSHLFKVGGEYSYVKASDYNPTNEFGSFNFVTDTSTLPNTASISVGFFNPNGTQDARASLTGHIVGFYANDEWRPVPNFTLNLGLRYDAELNTLNNDFDSPWAKDPVLQAIPVLQPFLNRGDRENDLNNISPRVSFSWDPFKTNRTFVRGGYGIIFDRVTSFMGFNERLSASWRNYSFTNPGTTDANVLRQRVIAGGVSLTPAPTLVKHRMETPENRQWSLGLGHQFTDELGINVDYVSQRMNHLYVRWNPNYFNTVTRARTLTPRYGDLTLFDDFGEAKFDGFVTQATYQKRDTRVNLAYTLGWYKSQFDGNLSAVFALRSLFDMQRTSGDERHRIVLSEVSKIPFGFTLSSITTIASPRPFVRTDGRDLNSDNIFTDDFPDGQRTVRPDAGWADWYRTVDLRLARDLFAVGKQRVSLSAEVFNVFNWDNRSTYSAVANTAAGVRIAAFGSPTGAFAARQAQVGMKVQW